MIEARVLDRVWIEHGVYTLSMYMSETNFRGARRFKLPVAPVEKLVGVRVKLGMPAGSDGVHLYPVLRLEPQS